MRNFLAQVLLVVAGLTGVANAQEGHVAMFKSVTGDVKIIRDKVSLVPVAGTRLMRLDVVVSGPMSSGGIAFIDGTLLTLDSSSEVEISRYVFQPEVKKYDFSLYLKKGSAVYSSGKLGKISPDSVSVNTPHATVGVRGTRFIVNAE